MQAKENNYEICAVLLTSTKAPHISAIEIMRGSTTMYSHVGYNAMARCESIANEKKERLHACVKCLKQMLSNSTLTVKRLLRQQPVNARFETLRLASGSETTTV